MDQDEIRTALRKVVDPELGIDIVELGLVYDIEIDGDDVRVRMTMTSAACPLHGHLAKLAEDFIREQVDGVGAIAIEVVWDPPWTAEMMSADARRKLGW